MAGPNKNPTKKFDLVYEIKDWALWIGGSMIAAMIIINIASFVMGTSTPFIAVTTSSMVHDDTTGRTYLEWMQNNGFTKDQLSLFPFSGGFSPGDAIIVLGVKPENIRVGDVIIYDQQGYPMPIIHRVIQIQQKDGVYYFFTKGDHNSIQDPWAVSQDKIKGRAWFMIPFLGMINTIFVRVVMFLKGTPL